MHMFTMYLTTTSRESRNVADHRNLTWLRVKRKLAGHKQSALELNSGPLKTDPLNDSRRI